jgi:transcriptional regulator with XRE-family HTH domain
MNTAMASKDEQLQVLYADVGNKIRERREELGLTQQALASAVDLSRTSITNIEQGRQKLLVNTLFDIAKVLEVSMTDLLPESGVSTGDEMEQLVAVAKISGRAKKWITSTF